MIRVAIVLFLISTVHANAEIVSVKYRGPVDINTFECPQIKPSSLVKRLCYHSGKRYVIVNLQGTYYHYCEIGKDAVAAFIAAESLGRYYNANIRVSSNGGLYDCRNYVVPQF